MRRQAALAARRRVTSSTRATPGHARRMASSRSSSTTIRAASGTLHRTSAGRSASSAAVKSTMSPGPSSSVAVLPASSSSRRRIPSTTMIAKGCAIARAQPRGRPDAGGEVGDRDDRAEARLGELALVERLDELGIDVEQRCRPELDSDGCVRRHDPKVPPRAAVCANEIARTRRRGAAPQYPGEAMAAIPINIAEHVGNTPMVRLTAPRCPTGVDVELYGKLEAFNPGGVGEGPHRRRDDRGGRGRGADRAGAHDDRRGHVRQHRHRARVRAARPRATTSRSYAARRA